jgi:aminoglycoside phosphotransferase (APT) family kinase protein
MQDAVAGDEIQARVVAWIEAELGPVRHIERQGRWRPAWYVEAEVQGQPQQLYVRGAREGGWPPAPLAYEARIQQLFAAEGVKVPHVHGFIEDVPAIVMARAPGRPNMATAASEAVRDRLREQLADQMLKIHGIDPARVEVLGSPTPTDPRELTLNHYRPLERLYLSRDRLPAPDMAFARRWIDRNVPPCVEGPCVITFDAGQFIFEGDELTAMLDFELAGVGDRHVDFAALTTRTRFEEIGDLEAFYELYRRRGGPALDRRRIKFHRVCFTLATPLQIACELAHPETTAEYFELVWWQILSMSDVLKEIGENMGVTLPVEPTPPAAPTRNGMLLEALTRVVDSLPASDDAYVQYRLFNLGLAVKYLAGYEGGRTAYETRYLSDVEGFVGRRPADLWEADVLLETFVQTAGPELDLSLLKTLQRRNQLSLDIMREVYDRRRLSV